MNQQRTMRLLATLAAAVAMTCATALPRLQLPSSPARIRVEATPVPLHPDDPSVTAIGAFRYAGGLALRSSDTTTFHELSDIVIHGTDHLVAVGDAGVLFEARLVVNEAGWLSGITDATITPLLGENAQRLSGADGDAEGLTFLGNGDRLVSFERHHRILRYPHDGGLPRPVSAPPITLLSNAGLEALAGEDGDADEYLVGVEASGETWKCHLTSPCRRRARVRKAPEFGLVAMNLLPDDSIAYLLRAFDPVRRSRIILEIVDDDAVTARMELAPPLTVDNFEGLASVQMADRRRRFYLVSDDNNRASQRTLLLSFDWESD